MRLNKVLRDMSNDNNIKMETSPIQFAIVAYHNKNNEIGSICYTEDYGELKVIDYISQGYMQEVEITTMVDALVELHNKSEDYFNKIMLTLVNYKHIDEVEERLKSYDIQISKEVM